MKPEIAIIIPTLDEEHYLPNILQDLVDQTEKNFEVIVVDAKSTDKTKEKAEQFKSQLSLLFIESPKKKVAFQRNLGAKHATAPYFFFIDADTRIDSHVIERVLRHIKNEKRLLYLPFVQSSNQSFMNRMLVKCTTLSVIALKKIGKPLSLGGNIIIEKDFFNKLNGFNELLFVCEDHNLVIRSHELGVKAELLPDVVCVFSMRRFESQGAFEVLWKYGLFTIETLIKGGVYSKAVKYDMGGLTYKKRSNE